MFKQMPNVFRALALAAIAFVAPSLQADPKSLCYGSPGMACITPFFQNINCCGGNNLAGIEEILVTVNGTSYTTNDSPDPGYITILGTPGNNYLIVPPSAGGNSSNVGRCYHHAWDDEWHPNNSFLVNVQSYSSVGAYEPVLQAVCEF